MTSSTTVGAGLAGIAGLSGLHGGGYGAATAAAAAAAAAAATTGNGALSSGLTAAAGYLTADDMLPSSSALKLYDTLQYGGNSDIASTAMLLGDLQGTYVTYSCYPHLLTTGICFICLPGWCSCLAEPACFLHKKESSNSPASIYARRYLAVSYTHLTLPTIYSV